MIYIFFCIPFFSIFCYIILFIPWITDIIFIKIKIFINNKFINYIAIFYILKFVIILLYNFTFFLITEIILFSLIIFVWSISSTVLSDISSISSSLNSYSELILSLLALTTLSLFCLIKPFALCLILTLFLFIFDRILSFSSKVSFFLLICFLISSFFYLIILCFYYLYI